MVEGGESVGAVTIASPGALGHVVENVADCRQLGMVPSPDGKRTIFV
jgi:hypothetical protein